MAKFFQRKEKPAEKPQDSGMPKGMRALTPEEARKADQLRVNMTNEQLRNVFRAAGLSEEKLNEAFPEPLPEAEQQQKLMELRKVFATKDYPKIIKTFRPVAESGLLSGDVLEEHRFAVGFAGMMIKDREIIEEYGQAAISFLLRSVKETGTEKTLGMVQYLMNLCEKEVPGSMKEQARKLYLVLVNILGKDHEFTREVKGYM